MAMIPPCYKVSIFMRRGSLRRLFGVYEAADPRFAARISSHPANLQKRLGAIVLPGMATIGRDYPTSKGIFGTSTAAVTHPECYGKDTPPYARALTSATSKPAHTGVTE